MTAHLQQGAEGAETKTDNDPDISEFGRVVWHSSDEDGGPDVGVTIGFGSGRALWFGEISKKMHEEEGAEAAELGSDLGTWIILYDDNKPRGEQATVIGKAIPYVGTDLCDAISSSLKAALASRADGAGVTVGEVRVERVTRAILDQRGFHYADDPMEFGQNAYDITNEARAEAIAVLNALGEQHASPAPAAGQAGAVPDSLRALSEVVYLLRIARCGLAAYGAGAFEDTIARIDAILASVPAGQSAGSGAEDQRPLRMRLADTILNGVRMGQEGAFTNLNKTLDDVLTLFAPVSTRTGDEGTAGETAHAGYYGVPVQALHDAWTVLPQTVRDNWERAAAALATRPAAPEAQGAERVRHVKRGTEYEVLGEAEAQIATRSTCPDGVGGGVLPNSSILREGDKLTVYRGSDDKLWCRFTDEFRDGRFAPASSGQGGR